MGLRGFSPATNADYETFRNRQVPLAGVDTEKDYQLVARIASPDIPTAFIDAHNLHLRRQTTGHIALSGLLLSDDFNDGIRYFQMYEEPDETGRETLYPYSESGIQLLIHEFGRIQLMYGYLIDNIATSKQPFKNPAKLFAHSDK
jgi:hypothetical protein